MLIITIKLVQSFKNFRTLLLGVKNEFSGGGDFVELVLINKHGDTHLKNSSNVTTF